MGLLKNLRCLCCDSLSGACHKLYMVTSLTQDISNNMEFVGSHGPSPRISSVQPVASAVFDLTRPHSNPASLCGTWEVGESSISGRGYILP